MTEQLLDVKGSARLIRRSWRLVALFILVGLLAAAGYVVPSLPHYQASALVLLPSTPSLNQGTSNSSSRSATTDARIATTAAVIGPAGRKVDPTASLSQIQQHLQASTVAPDVVKISATARTRAQAIRLANAVASQLVAFVTTSGAAADASIIAGLDAQEHQLEKQLADIRKEAATVNRRLSGESASSSAAKQDSALLATLTSQEQGIGLQLSSVKSQISSDQFGQVSGGQGTEVIQPATTATPPSIFSLVLPFFLGLLGGALVGSVVVLGRHRARPRLWTRDALAEALGAPVVLSLDVAERRSLGAWIQLLEYHEPGSQERWSVLKMLRELGFVGGAKRNLVVVAFAADVKGIAQGVHLAVAAASSGISTELGVRAPHGTQRTLQAACHRYAGDGPAPRACLTVLDVSRRGSVEGAGLTVTLVVTDVNNPSEVMEALGPRDVCVASVSSGFPSARELARLGIAASEGGSPIRALCVANAERQDETIGRFPMLASSPPLVELRMSPVEAIEMERSR